MIGDGRPTTDDNDATAPERALLAAILNNVVRPPSTGDGRRTEDGRRTTDDNDATVLERTSP